MLVRRRIWARPIASLRSARYPVFSVVHGHRHLALAMELRLATALGLGFLGLLLVCYNGVKGKVPFVLRGRKTTRLSIAPTKPFGMDGHVLDDGRDLRAQRFLVEDPVAKCLNGDAPAYYFRPGVQDGANKWLLVYDGGGWCHDTHECFKRSYSKLGGTRDLPQWKEFGWSMMNTTQGYLFRDWNVVYIRYCDGSFFTSDRMDTEYHLGRTLYYRGKYIHEAIVKNLLETKGLDSAEEVVVSGCSAGGQIVMMNIDRLAKMLPPTTILSGVPDSGFMVEYDSDDATCDYKEKMVPALDFHNAHWSLPQGCVDQFKDTGDTWKCFFFANYMIPHIQTPLFVLQSRFDRYQIKDIFCASPDNTKAINEFGSLFAREFKNTMDAYPQHGYLLYSCFMHCGGWDFIEEDSHGYSQQEAFAEWYAWRLRMAKRTHNGRVKRKRSSKNSEHSTPVYGFTHNADYECYDCCSADHAVERGVWHPKDGER